MASPDVSLDLSVGGSMDLEGVEYLVVGAGISGLTVARRLADRGRKVVLIDARQFLGGLSASYVDRDTGIECHRFGTHVLHSSNPAVIQFMERFCHLNHYRHRVFVQHGDSVYPFPINLYTLNQFFESRLSPQGAKRFLASMAQQFLFSRSTLKYSSPIDNLEDAAIKQMGLRLYEAFIEGYSYKQWGVPPHRLPASLLGRIPVRTDYNSDYFLDSWQGLPMDGYETLFSRMGQGFTSVLSVDYHQIREMVPPSCKVVYSGCLDEYFRCQFGVLPWRSVRFERSTIQVKDYQGCAVMNFADPRIKPTRSHEFRHLHPERKRYVDSATVVSDEFAGITGQKAYPVDPDGELANRYRLAAQEEASAGVFFCGRLGTYRYLNMDEAVAEALTLADGLLCLRT